MADSLEYLGVIGRTHGTDGTVLLQDTPGPFNEMAAGTTVLVGFSKDFAKNYAVASFDGRPPHFRLQLRGIDTLEKAKELIDQAVYGPASALAIQGDRYSIGDIEGCKVVLEDGTELGVITDIWLMPANDVWIVTQPDGHTIPLPVIDDVILHVHIAERTVIVHLLDGLMDINRNTGEESDA